MMTDRNTPAETMFVGAQYPEALSELDKLALSYFKASVVGLAIVDSGMHYIAVTKRLAEMNGVPAEQHLGRTVREILGEAGDSVEKKIAEVLVTERALELEISGTIPSRTESVRWIAQYLPFVNAQGAISQVGAVVLEVRTPKGLEGSLRKLRQQTSRLQILTDVTSQLSSNWDVGQVFPRVSARLRRVLAQEFASFALHDAGTGLLVYQVTDFPLSKGRMPTALVSPVETPAGQSMDRKAFLELVQEHSEIGLHTAKCLSRDYQSAYRDIHDLVLTRSSAGKLARLLLSQAVREDDDPDGGSRPTPMTHEEMAMRIGASRETVTRLISTLRRKRLIRLDGPLLVIKDRMALEALAV